MQATAKTTLASLVQDHITSVVNEAVCIGRHAKRARHHGEYTVRRRLHADDINLALQWRGSSKLYGTSVVVPNEKDSVKKVDLNTYLKSEMSERAPSELGMTMHWLAVDGNQPSIPQNPTKQIHTAIVKEENSLDKESVRVRQLLPRLLSEELQLYFTRITLAMDKGDATPLDMQQQDAALLRVSRDAGLQELVPFFIQYLAKHIYLHIGSPQHLRTLMRLTRSLLLNPHAHLELHLHQLLPPIVSCIVAKTLCTAPADNHWALRDEAAQTLLQACDL